MEKDDIYIYVGRESCPWCCKLMPVLYEFLEENNFEMYYIDSTDTDISNDIKSFREKNNIEYVPSIIYLKNDKIYMLEFDVTVDDFDKQNIVVSFNNLNKKVINSTNVD